MDLARPGRVTNHPVPAGIWCAPAEVIGDGLNIATRTSGCNAQLGERCLTWVGTAVGTWYRQRPVSLGIPAKRQIAATAEKTRCTKHRDGDSRAGMIVIF